MTKDKPSKAATRRGNARAEALAPEERSEIARHAARKRWEGAPSLIRRETHPGVLNVAGYIIPCSVLDDGTRVLSTKGFEQALGSAQKGKRRSDADDAGAAPLPAFLASEGIKPNIPDDLMVPLRSPIMYKPKHGGRHGVGYEATLLPAICKAILQARRLKMLKPQQMAIADAAEIILTGLAHVGIVALIDEATGYQQERARDELHQILSAYISEELLKWAKRFPDEFFKQVYRVHGWNYEPGNTKGPRYVGKIIKKYIYGKLPPGVLGELEAKNPPVEGRRRFKHFQWLSQDTGHPHLDKQIVKVTTLLQISDNPKEFERVFQRAFPCTGQQTELTLSTSDDEES